MCALFSKAVAEKPQQPFSFHYYDPVIPTDRLVPGIDNIRFDVCLSSKFMEHCRNLIFQLMIKHSEAAKLLQNPPGPPKPADKKELQQRLQALLIHTLNNANVQKNPQLELLAQAAILKYLAGEMQAQYAAIVIQAREKLKLFESPDQQRHARGYELQEVFGNFQKNKKILLRRVSQELLGMIQDVRGDVVRKTRESFFGSESSEPHAVFANPLLFAEDGKDDFLYLERYLMLGNFQRDMDRFERVDEQVRKFLEWADSHSPESLQYRREREAFAELQARLEQLRQQQEEQRTPHGLFSWGGKSPEANAPERLAEEIASLEAQLQDRRESFNPISASYTARLVQILSAPKNASLLVDFLETEQVLENARKNSSDAGEIALLQQRLEQQREALEKLQDQFSRAGLIPFILAAYETAKIYQDFCPPMNPQQLKVALVDSQERKKVVHLIQEYRLAGKTVETLEESARRVRDAGERQIRPTLVRFLQDYMRCQWDLCHFRLVQNLMEKIYLPIDPKQRDLSEINHTLYQFLLPEEEKPAEEKVSSHVVMKADIRDSTSITAELFARGLNPASYFSLNFFDPVRKMMPRYGARKVFLEGDAMILAILEREGDSQEANSVAKACSLAREMMEGVRALNERATQNHLPLLELGIGICYQPAAPMYLIDDGAPIMISKALNESDRLSSCGKLARQVLAQKNRFFNVFVMQLLSDADSRGAAEEFFLHYNVQGIEINELAFHKLCRELALSKVELQLPLFGEPEPVELYCGSLPLGSSSFQKIIIRQGRVPQLHPKDFHVVEYTERHYYEVCSAKPVYEYVSRKLGW
ncbi:MAG: hypothetical protein HYS38_00240 [Acidobacteria bacterium]|nr:hypothetical protein [Acidobacteriota bacterium]